MASGTMLGTFYLVEPWRPSKIKNYLSSSPFNSLHQSSLTTCACKSKKARKLQPLNCSTNSHSSNNDPSLYHDESDLEPPQEAVLKAISELSKTEGRVGQTTNMVIGGTVTDDASDEWLVLDQKVNSYPTVREFTAIGTGGDDFVHAMVIAVESVLHQPIPQGQVKQKASSGGKYVSVNIGPVQVISSEQVQAVYNAMRRDDRMKYFL